MAYGLKASSCDDPSSDQGTFTPVGAQGGSMEPLKNRGVASRTVPVGQEFHFPHFFSNFLHFFLIFPETFLIFVLILALWVGDLPTQGGPGYATA